jgi:hypothetical protein
MDLFSATSTEPTVHPGRKLEGRLVGCFLGDLPDFRTRPVDTLTLDLEGADGDGHRGFTRSAGSREPWHPRGVEIRSGRQLSVVSSEELAEVAERLSVPAIDAGLIGANLAVADIPRFSFLPAGTRLFFPGGAVVVIEAMNAPCRDAGEMLARAHPGRVDIALGFVAAAKRRRGVVASVERAGAVTAGDRISVRIAEQWIWAG